MPSEYDALLESTPAQKSEYDALLAQQPKSSVLGEIGTAIKNTAVGFVKGLARPPSLAEIALPIFGGQIERQYEHAKAAEQAIRGGQPAAQSIAQAYAPNVSELASPEATRGQKIQAGVNIAAEVAPFLVPALRGIGKYGVAGRSLSDIAFGAKPEPLAAETAAVEQIQKGGEISAQKPYSETGAVSTEQGKPAISETAVQAQKGDTRQTPAQTPNAPQVAPAVPQPEQPQGIVLYRGEGAKEKYIGKYHGEAHYASSDIESAAIYGRAGQVKSSVLPESANVVRAGSDIANQILASDNPTATAKKLKVDAIHNPESMWVGEVSPGEAIVYNKEKLIQRELTPEELAKAQRVSTIANEIRPIKSPPVSEGGAGIQPPISKEIKGKTPATGAATVTTGTGEGVSQPTETTPAVTEPTTAAPLKGDEYVYHGASPARAKAIRESGRITAGDYTRDYGEATGYGSNLWNPSADKGSIFVIRKSDMPKGGLRAEGGAPYVQEINLQTGEITTPVSEAQPATTAQPLTQTKGGVSEEVQKAQDEGQGRQGVLTPEAATVQPPAVPPETPEELGQALKEPGRTAGVANRILQERAVKGEIPQAPAAGQGHLTEDIINKSRAEYSPERALVAAQNVKNGSLSEADAGQVRIHEEALTKAAANAEKALDADPKNPALKQGYETAKAALMQWHNDTVQPMKTTWSNAGKSMQGATDIDTGSYIGLQKLAWDTAKRDFTAKEEPVMKAAAKRVSNLTDDVRSAISKAEDQVQKVLKPSKYMDLNQLRESLAETLKSITC